MRLASGGVLIRHRPHEDRMSARVLCPSHKVLPSGILKFRKGADYQVVVVEHEVGVARDAISQNGRGDESSGDNARRFAASLFPGQ